ncbi:MAG: hypothetical protein LBH80_04480, partial [Prevotellaceae bacterium]|nr:hypothetical protein [Prevotellaceae bacterium]
SCFIDTLSTTFTITQPEIEAIENIAVCSGETIDSIIFTSSYQQVTYKWENNRPDIGIPDSGIGNIPAFKASNTTNAPITATIKVHPFIDHCDGNDLFFDITIYPEVEITNSIANSTVLSGTEMSGFVFEISLPDAIVNWTNDNPSIGLPLSGVGNISAFTAVNTTNVIQKANIKAIATGYDGCNNDSIAFNITVYPEMKIIVAPDTAVCHNENLPEIALTTSVSDAVVSWTNDNPSIGLPPSGVGNIPPFTAVNTTGVVQTANIYVMITYDDYEGRSAMFNITVYPHIEMHSVPDTLLCHNEKLPEITLTASLPDAIVDWTNDNPSIGLPSSGVGNIPAFNVVNTTGDRQTAHISVVASYNGCTGDTIAFSITIDPEIKLEAVSDTAVCHSEELPEIVFTTSQPDAIVSWTNDNPSIGLPPSGTGNIPPFTAMNTTGDGAPQTANISAVASYNGCDSDPIVFGITVYSAIAINTVSNTVVCHNEELPEITLTASVSNVVIGWTNDNPSIGLPPSGAGSIPAFTAVNTTGDVQTANIQVTASSDNCTGSSMAFNITVHPEIKLEAVPDTAVCHGEELPEIVFTTSLPDAVVSWTNDNPSIGLPPSGVGNIPAFNVVNTTGDVQTANISVVASYNGCDSNPIVFGITVYSEIAINIVPDTVVCHNEELPEITLTASAPDAVIGWTNDNPSIGLPSSGAGSIPPFTAVNTTDDVQTANITVVADGSNNCTGGSMTFNITVRPEITIDAVPDTIVCHDEEVAGITLTASAPDAVIGWTNDNPSIGLPPSGVGNIPAFTPVNDSDNDVIATIVVTASHNGCDGVPVEFTITVKPPLRISLKELPEICGDASGFFIEYDDASGRVEKYSLKYDKKALQAGFTNQTNITPLRNKLVEVPLPGRVRPDIYTVDIVFEGDKSSETIPVEFVVNYPTSILKQKWNDVISLINSEYNGGYEFSNYEWYINDTKIEDAFGSYIYISGNELDFRSVYRVKLTRVDDGLTLFTCPFIPERRNEEFSIYPTLVYQGDDITIDVGKDGEIELWDIFGRKLKNVGLQAGRNKVKAPSNFGSYLLIITFPEEEEKHSTFIMVK